MRLTCLEIKGFKSFGDRVIIQFNEGITGIVGPNGCGKSNVVDAIRWVLGEQKTRALRSDKMENIIFNGTKNRKASQLAEVSLTFDNTKNLLPTEYSQVTITRRYYRSGDSEYELNGVPCRLKDITGLFMDTGIASNSYAIIELKMIDELLNDKENSRRALFEEAAGISKFKSHKKQTLRKLEDTDADLDRVEDLLFEIDKNLKSLERQARQAERYFTLKKEYKAASIKLAWVRLHDQEEGKVRIARQLTEESDRQEGITAARASQEARLEETKKGVLEAERLLSSRQKSLNTHVSNIRQLESEKKLKNERLRFLYDRRDSLQNQIVEDRQSAERAIFTLERLEAEIESVQKHQLEAEALLSRKQEAKILAQEQATQYRSRLAEVNQLYKSIQEEVYSLQKSLEMKQMQVSSLQQELEKTARDSHQSSSSLSEYRTKLAQLSEDVQVLEQEYEQLQQHDFEHKEKLAQAELSAAEAQQNLNKLRRTLDARQNEYALTKSLVDNLEGFPEAIKYLKKQTSWGKEAPLLSDIFTSSAEYRIALETYLEPYLNYYVVETLAQAQEGIKQLREANRGRANFFVLELLDGNNSYSPNYPPNTIPALKLIETDSRYSSLARYLFSSVCFAEDNFVAETFAEVTVITKSGQAIYRPKSLTGGSVGLFEGNRIGRAKNLENLKVEVQQLKKEADKQEKLNQHLQEEYGQLKAYTVQPKLEELRKQLSRVQQDKVQVQTQYEQLLRFLENQSGKQEELQDKMVELREQLEEIEPTLKEKRTLLNSLTEELEVNSSEAQRYGELLATASEAYNQQNISYHQVSNQIQRLEQEWEFKTTNRKTTQERLLKNEQEFNKISTEIDELLQRNEVGDDELQALYTERGEIERGVNEAEQSYYQSRGEVDAIEKNLREIQRQRESSQALTMELKNKLNEINLQINSVQERLSVEFGEEALKELSHFETEEELPNLETCREENQKLKEKIERIGPINPMAMEAYEEIKERHTFISTQRDDLLAAKLALEETMEQLDTAAREAFLDAFEKIKVNFIKVFRSLFTEEDDCDLKLVNPESPLESAIDIIAKPKGKRPLTINQLSGGEKTLTATSLLFSIYLLKPAPFCIFDEVDAPLDDANIDKFNNIIRKFSEESQFIIVTHNKRTMASTDIMYGVTMLEQGVSRVVPVDLRELEVTA
jgi:chromosome segregation protein